MTETFWSLVESVHGNICQLSQPSQLKFDGSLPYTAEEKTNFLFLCFRTNYVKILPLKFHLSYSILYAEDLYPSKRGTKYKVNDRDEVPVNFGTMYKNQTLEYGY